MSACSLCCSCDNVCPAKVNLSEQIYLWRQGLDALGKADPMKKLMSRGMKIVFDRPALYNTALRFAPLANHAPRFLVYNGLNARGKGRELPVFAKKPLDARLRMLHQRPVEDGRHSPGARHGSAGRARSDGADKVTPQDCFTCREMPMLKIRTPGRRLGIGISAFYNLSVAVYGQSHSIPYVGSFMLNLHKKAA